MASWWVARRKVVAAFRACLEPSENKEQLFTFNMRSRQSDSDSECYRSP